MRKLLLHIFFLFHVAFLSAQSDFSDTRKVDSLTVLLKSTGCDTCKIKIIFQLTNIYGTNDPHKTFFLMSEALSIAEKINNPKFIATCNRNIGVVHYFIGNYNASLEKLNASQKLFEKLNDKEGEAKTLIWLGTTYFSIASYDKALEAQLKSLKLYESLNDKTGIAGALNGVANIFRVQHNLKKALTYYFRSLVIRKELDEPINIAYNYNNIGLIYAEADSLEKSLEYHLQCLHIVERANDKKGMANSYGNIGEVYNRQRKFKNALVCLFKSLALSEEISDKNGMSASYYEIGKTFLRSGNSGKALDNYYKGLEIAKEINDKDAIKDFYGELALVYAAGKDFKKALDYFEFYSSLKDSILNEGNTKNMEEMQTRFETEKKEKEIELLQKDKNIRELDLSRQQADINRQRIIIYSIVGGLLLISILIFFIIKSYRQKKKINIGLERKNTEINLQRNLIEEKNILITDSIDYARNIQNAILPSDAVIKNYIPESFILFLPKDIVSGDFYWLSPLCSPLANVSPTGKKNNSSEGILLAAVDCTGHGVPGAFMSVMAFNMLEDIVAEKKITQPALILNELNNVVVETLHQDAENTSTKYGMDISLLSINKNKLQFAGAHNPLCLVRENKLTEIKADKTTIGMAKEKFLNHSIEIEKGDMIYIFTDGYADQKGGPENKKFFSATLKELFLSIANKNPVEQKNILEQTFSDWKNSTEQLDDVLVMGIRI